MLERPRIKPTIEHGIRLKGKREEQEFKHAHQTEKEKEVWARWERGE